MHRAHAIIMKVVILVLGHCVPQRIWHNRITNVFCVLSLYYHHPTLPAHTFYFLSSLIKSISLQKEQRKRRGRGEHLTARHQLLYLGSGEIGQHNA